MTQPSTPKQIRHSRGLLERSWWESSRPWPADCFVQSGGRGPFFVEAFPREPDVYLRAEGATLEEAEATCWAQYQHIASCPGHEWEPVPGYDNGMGRCKLCRAMTTVFPPSGRCVVCGAATCYTRDTEGAYYCETHEGDKPREKWTSLDHMKAELDAAPPLTDDDIREGLQALADHFRQQVDGTVTPPSSAA